MIGPRPPAGRRPASPRTKRLRRRWRASPPTLLGSPNWCAGSSARSIRLRWSYSGRGRAGDERAESDVDLLVVMPDAWAGVGQRRAAVTILTALRDLPVAKDVVVTTPAEIARRGHLTGTVLQRALAEGTVLEHP